jgi:hypothetical protein
MSARSHHTRNCRFRSSRCSSVTKGSSSARPYEMKTDGNWATSRRSSFTATGPQARMPSGARPRRDEGGSRSTRSPSARARAHDLGSPLQPLSSRPSSARRTRRRRLGPGPSGRRRHSIISVRASPRADGGRFPPHLCGFPCRWSSRWPSSTPGWPLPMQPRTTDASTGVRRRWVRRSPPKRRCWPRLAGQDFSRPVRQTSLAGRSLQQDAPAQPCAVSHLP